MISTRYPMRTLFSSISESFELSNVREQVSFLKTLSMKEGMLSAMKADMLCSLFLHMPRKAALFSASLRLSLLGRPLPP